VCVRARRTLALTMARGLSCQGPAEWARAHGIRTPRIFQELHRVPRLLLSSAIPSRWRRQGEAFVAGRVADVLRLFMAGLWDHVRPHLDDDFLRRSWILANFAYGCINGIIRDDL